MLSLIPRFSRDWPRESRRLTSPPLRRNADANVRSYGLRRARGARDTGRRQLFLYPGDGSLIQTRTFRRFNVRLGLLRVVRIEGGIGISRCFDGNRCHLRSLFQNLGFGHGRRAGERVHFDAGDVGRTRAVGVRGGHGQLKIDGIGAARGDEIGRSDGQFHERRQRRALLAARRCEECGKDRDRQSAVCNLQSAISAILHRMYRDRSSFFTMSASIFVT